MVFAVSGMVQPGEIVHDGKHLFVGSMNATLA